jgi:hypothetical protein
MMHRFLLSAFLLLAGVGAASAQELFPLQAVPSGSSGCLPGSYCPAGFTWINDLDEHFTSPTSTAFTVSTASGGIGGVDNCSPTNAVDTPGVLTWNAPGIIIKASTAVTNGGCTLSSTSGYSTPGYFEWESIVDEGGPLWQSQWLGIGANGSGNVDKCGFGAGGTEIDYPDNQNSNGPSPQPEEQPSFFFPNNYNGGCQGGGSNGTVAQFWGDGNPHVFGVDYGDNNSLTFFYDGVQQGAPFTPTTNPGNTGLPNMEPGTCPAGTAPWCVNGNWWGQFWFSNHFNNAFGPPNAASTGLHLFWVRHYHH